MKTLEREGWEYFPFDQTLADWVEGVLPVAVDCASDPELRDSWLRHGNTWFAGVNVLPNDETGNVGVSGPLRGKAVEAARARFGNLPWDAGQVSVVYPGYPKQDVTESDANHRFRLKRDAAHVDGLLPEGPDRRRFIREHHAFILGIPLTECDRDASPLVVWEGSHKIIREALCGALTGHHPENWSDVDITNAYQVARNSVFASCRRVEVQAKPGEAYLVHRLAVHGVAPWSEGASSSPAGRMILYFRPELPGAIADWLNKN